VFGNETAAEHGSEASINRRTQSGLKHRYLLLKGGDMRSAESVGY